MSVLHDPPHGASAHVRIAHDGPIAIVELDREETRNALDSATLAALVALLRSAGENPGTRVVILRGANGTFCSGDDLHEASRMSRAEFLSHIKNFQELTRTLHKLEQPVIASIAGHARGGGLEMALACDIRIAGSDATFAFPEARLGLTITNGASRLLARQVGETRALHLVMLGEVLDAATAERYGLVSRVVPAARLAEETAVIAETLVRTSANALRITKRLVHEPDDVLEAALAAETSAVMEAFDHADAREGLLSFQQRRAPRFEGSGR
jgi:enoyl-CoA hydratase/carnithine racemase